MAKTQDNSTAEQEIERQLAKIRKLAGDAEFTKAHELAVMLKKKYPENLKAAYYEAVMTAEDTTGLTKVEANRRFKLATKKFRVLLGRLKSESKELRHGIRNEYYWFSKQPYKQYLLGIESVKNGVPRAHYSQGVGAAMLAKKYAEEGRVNLMLKWAKRSELAWEKFFQVDPNWFNAYFFYAMALGFQNKFKQMERALLRASRLAGKPPGWRAIREQRKEILDALQSVDETCFPKLLF